MLNASVIRSVSRLIILGGLLAIVGCQSTPKQLVSPSPSSKPSTANSSQNPIKSASRVVALTSLSADIIYRLSPNKLVGVTGSKLIDRHPGLSKSTRVAEGRTPPNLEKIVALQPDLVIGSAGMHDQVLAQLQQSGIQTLATKIDRWEALPELTKTLAQAVEADPEPLLKSYQGYFDPKPNQTASTLILASDRPLLSPNSQSWAGNLLTQLGIKNVVANLQGKSQFSGYITLSPEKLVEIDPEVLILINTPNADINRVKDNPLFKQLKATKNNRVYVLDYYGLVNPGSIEAIEQATKRLRQIF
jgi:iron complex transport system substrate-binding protein